MKKMNYAEPIIDVYNAIVGTVVAVLSYILGEHWILFVAFLLLNIADWLTGWMKSRMAKKENSVKGWKGVLKKLGYWLMIMVAFWSKCSIHRNRKDYRSRFTGYNITWMVCTCKLAY